MACLCLTRKQNSLTTQWATVSQQWRTVHRRVQLHTGERFKTLLTCWREQWTRYYQSNAIVTYRYRGGLIIVWAEISFGNHTDLHVFHVRTLIGVRYRDKVLDPYARPYAGAIGNDFVLMDDNARNHRTVVVKVYLEGHGLERMKWLSHSPDLNPIIQFWNNLGRQVVLSPPPRSLDELEQGLFYVWSSVLV